MPIPARGAILAAFLCLVVAARAMVVVPPTFSELVAEAETVVRGVVIDQRAEEFESPQGRGIRTLVTLRVERVLKGAPRETVTLTLLGGTVGRRSLRIAGMPAFTVGDRQLVFIAGNGRVFCPVVASGHGRFHVQRDPATGRDLVARDNGRPLLSKEEIGTPLGAQPLGVRLASGNIGIGLAEFEAQILAAIPAPRPSATRP
jgi:hypothetical protein